MTGGVPTLVASCTRNKFSLFAVLPSTVCNKATDANHVDKASVLNSPEHKSCPAVNYTQNDYGYLFIIYNL